jgi:hypothetical protein
MNENSNLQCTEETINSIIVDDLEGQNIIISEKIKSDQVVPLRGILKKTDLILVREEGGLIVIKLCRSIILIVVISPFIVADLYFGFTDNSCINEHLEKFEISMKIYLLTSGFVGILTMLFSLREICRVSKNDTNNTILYCEKCILYILGIFHFVWNIIGEIVFWGKIFIEDTCDKHVSNYLCMSLIIKLIYSLIIFNSINFQKK